MKYIFEAAIAIVIIWLIFESRQNQTATPAAATAPAPASYSGGLQPLASPPAQSASGIMCLACSHSGALGAGPTSTGALGHVIASPAPASPRPILSPVSNPRILPNPIIFRPGTSVLGVVNHPATIPTIRPANINAGQRVVVGL